MKMTRVAVDRPITTSMLVGIVIVISVVSLTRLPIDLMPDVQFPRLSISVMYPGATPEEIETLLTEPLEEALGSVDNVEDIETTSMEDQCSVRMSFTWGTDIDQAANDVRQQLDRVRGRLPVDAEPPVLYKFDFNQRPIIRYGLSSTTLDSTQLRYLAENDIKPRLERIAGVASVDIGGGRLREIQVELVQDKLDALELSPQTIVQAIRAENINLPAGEVFAGETQLVMRTKGQFVAPKELQDIVVATREGVPVYLRDVADVTDGYEELRQIERIDGEPGISLFILRQSGSNTVAVADQTHGEMEEIRGDYPEISVVTLFDSSKFIKDAIGNVRTAALYGSVLAILILLVFLRNLRATFIVATAIPISVLASFALLYFAGFSLNIVSFGGLALGIGMLVDNSIVVLENIFRHREEGLDARTAAIQGTEEVTTAIVASTMTTLVVFLPLLFLSGAASVMFTQLAYVVVLSQVCSLIVGLTLVPSLARYMLRVESLDATPSETAAHRLYRISEMFLRNVEARYRALLGLALHHRYAVVNGCALVFVISLPMFDLLGFEYMPKTDEGEVRVSGRMAPGTKLESLDEAFSELEGIVRKTLGPDVRHMSTQFGLAPWQRASGTNTGRIEVSLAESTRRTRTSEEIADALRPRIGSIPGLDAFARASGGLFVFRVLLPDGESLAVEVRGHDRTEAFRIAQLVKDTLETVDGITDAQLDRSEGRPEIGLHIDRYKAAQAGFTLTSIAESIRTSFGGEVATRYREGGEEYDVRVRLKESDREALQDLRMHWLTSPTGERVPASNFVREERTIGPSAIMRRNQERVLTVAADLEPGRDLGSIMEVVQSKLASFDLPEGITLEYGGEYEDQQRSYRELMLGMALAILLVYMVMAAQFESLIQPLVIMFSLPFAATGVLLVLWITGTTINIQSILGSIVLVGIAVNNAIVLVDYINLLHRDKGMPLIEAVVEGGRRRLRPILMTTLTTVLGLIPMAMGLGSGGELQAPMARVIFGGLLTSTLVTLVLVPVIYTSVEEYMARERAAVSRVEPLVSAK